MAAAPTSWTYERPRGCFPQAGIAVLLASVLSTVAVVMGTESAGWSWAVGMLMIAAAAVPLGLWLAFAHEGVTVDVAAGTVREYRTVFVTFKERFHVLADFRTVSILRQRVRKVEGVAYLYRVCLVGTGGVVELASPPSYPAARDVAVPLSELTSLPLVDGQWPVKG